MDELLAQLDWSRVCETYAVRADISHRLAGLHARGQVREFCELLLSPDANYSARDHGLAPRIRARTINGENVDQRLFTLASNFRSLTDAVEVPQIVKNAHLSYLGIGVGSEASCLLNPTVCWVTNVRTIWTHLALTHGGDVGAANEALELYRDHLNPPPQQRDLDMAYAIWYRLDRELRTSLNDLVRLSAAHVEQARIQAGPLVFLWADAIADSLYSRFAASRR